MVVQDRIEEDGHFRIGTLDGADTVRERRTTQELVFAFLRDAILSGRLRGGSRLVQDRIASELSVSRVPVREALLQLEAEGLVRMEAHRGASVVWLSPEEIAEIFELRGLLTYHAVKQVVPDLTDDQIARLEKLAKRQGNETNMAARSRLNHQFYAVLYERLRRPRFQSMLEKLEREVERYLEPLERPHLGHADVVDALRNRDAERAASILRSHLETVGERAVERVRTLVDSGEAHLPGRPRSRRRVLVGGLS